MLNTFINFKPLRTYDWQRRINFWNREWLKTDWREYIRAKKVTENNHEEERSTNSSKARNQLGNWVRILVSIRRRSFSKWKFEKVS